MTDKLIYTAIPAIIADVGPVGKNTKNQQQGYMYRSADDICDALHDALGKHKVFATCVISDLVRSERLSKNGGAMYCVSIKCTYTFHAADGSSVATEAIGDGMDSGDKATNKAMTAAYKYALIQVFAMMGQEDSERDSPETVPQPPRHAANGSANGHLANGTNGSGHAKPQPTEAWKHFRADCDRLIREFPAVYPDWNAVVEHAQFVLRGRQIDPAYFPDWFATKADGDKLTRMMEALEQRTQEAVPDPLAAEANYPF